MLNNDKYYVKSGTTTFPGGKVFFPRPAFQRPGRLESLTATAYPSVRRLMMRKSIIIMAALGMIINILLVGCATIHMQYKKFSGPISTILVVSSDMEFESLTKVKLSLSEYTVTASGAIEQKLDDRQISRKEIETPESLSKIKSMGYDAVLFGYVSYGGDGRPETIVFSLINAGTQKKALAGIWKGSGEDFTHYDRQLSDAQIRELLRDRSTLEQASEQIANRIRKEMPRSWWEKE